MSGFAPCRLKCRRFTLLKMIVILTITIQSILLFKSAHYDGSWTTEAKWKSLFATRHDSELTGGDVAVLRGNQSGINKTERAMALEVTQVPLNLINGGNWKMHEKVLMIGSNYGGERLSGHDGNTPQYLLIVPRFVVNAVSSIELFQSYDKQTLRFLVTFLDKSPGLDGVFGENDADKNGQFDSNVPCFFSRRETTLLVRNSGQLRSAAAPYQLCNMAPWAFLIRTEVFKKYKWVPEMGILAVLHFFLNAGGNIRMGKLSVGYTQEELDSHTRTDRGLLKGQRDFTEYQQFGRHHNILRIIYEDRIEWTHCAAHWALCKEEPYEKPQSLPQIAMPICCSTCLDVYLQDVTHMLDSLNIEYRVIYGTLLGGVRSNAIIPWTYDVDIGVTKDNYWNKTFYDKLQDYMGQRYWAGFSYIDTYRMHARFPPNLKYDFSDILNSNPDALFTDEIRVAIEKLAPIVTDWRSRGYVDFYPSPSVWLEDSGVVTINGRNYTTVAQIEYELKNWYGDFRTPVQHGHWVGRTDLGQV